MIDSRYFSIWVAGCIVLVFMGAATSADYSLAQSAPARDGNAGSFINVRITAAPSPEARAALEQLIEPFATAAAVAAAGAAPTVSAVCAATGGGVATECANVTEAINAAERVGASRSFNQKLIAPTLLQTKTFTVTEPPRFPDFQSKTVTSTSAREFVVFGANDPIVLAAGRLEGQSLAVPLESVAPIIKPEANLIGAPEKMALIDEDLRLLGVSERNFRINPILGDAKTEDLLQTLGAIRNSGVAVDRTLSPIDSFSLIQFETSGVNCDSAQSGWPFDVGRVKKILEFNEDFRHKMRLGAPKRSRILIVDTGLGKSLAQSSSFGPLLYAEPSELLSSIVARPRTNEARCVDANGNRYFGDVYGVGSDERSEEETKCKLPTFNALDLVSPHPRKLGVTQIYNPDHGSFVGALAGGGPDLLAAFPQIQEYVGLTFFRVPRLSRAPRAHVVNEFNAIGDSLAYAKEIKADIVNLSLKTARDEPFDGPLTGNEDVLLVAAAGNNGETLNDTASENRPASLESLRERMIVVAALQPNAAFPFWPSSARSKEMVHIAAPGALIASLDASGARICDSGTSAAAPLVSFTAATLKALTGARRAVIRARVLAAADNDPELKDKVEEGRRLNIEAALDIFVDRIELDGETAAMRGWIEPSMADALVSVCQPRSGGLEDTGGKIDLALLWQWRRTAEGRASLRHQGLTSNFAFMPAACKIPTGTFEFFDAETGKTHNIAWSSLRKMLPTPFRSGKAVIVPALQ